MCRGISIYISLEIRWRGCQELSIKMIRRQIEIESSSPNEVDEGNFHEVLRVAGEKALIADVGAWFRYRKMRNMTAHTYDHEKAHICEC